MDEESLAVKLFRLVMEVLREAKVQGFALAFTGIEAKVRIKPFIICKI